MQPIAQNNFEEFVHRLGKPVWRASRTVTWHEEDDLYFVAQACTRHLLLCIITPAPYECDATLEKLYQRAHPLRFMGLPVRVYCRKNQDGQMQIIGAIAISQTAVNADRLFALCRALRHLFA